MNSNRVGVLVVGHGTRDVIGQAQMRNLACQTAGCLAPLLTELGFLELATPSIEDGIRSLARQGINQLIVVPVLLFRAGHADSDIPDAVRAAAEPLGIQVLAQTPPLEHEPTVLNLSAERYREAFQTEAGHMDFAPAETCLAMIARGSSSESAAEAMEQFAELRCRQTPVGSCRVGYVAVRQPNVAATLDWLEASPAKALVIQPHLLFEGEVYHKLREDVAARRARDGRPWLVCKPLGAAAEDFEDNRLANVLAELARRSLSSESAPA